MSRFRIARMKRVVHNFQKRCSRQRALILMYHRVADPDSDPWGLCVSPQNFSEQLQVLQDKAHPMGLGALVQACEEGNLPARAVAVTFDDGYADNLYHAKPLLEQHDVPTTVFIATAYVGRKQEFWWDELEQLLLQPAHLPEKLSLNIRNHLYHWDVGETEASPNSEKAIQSDRSPKAWESQPGSRLFFYYSVWQQLLPLTEEERSNSLNQIRAWTTTEIKARPTHRSLSQEELIELGRCELVEIGAHTLTHPFLSAQPISQQEKEIQQSKAELEAILNRPITHFSYPFGNYTPETAAIVQKTGFASACTTAADFVWKGSKRFELPRHTVGNWNEEEFGQQLEGWFDA